MGVERSSDEGRGIGRRAALSGAAALTLTACATSAPRQSWRGLCPVCMDFHAHFLDLEILEAAEAHSPSSGFGRRPLPRALPFMRKLLDPAAQVADMDLRGVDRAVISSAAVIQGLSFADGEQAVALNGRVNAIAASWVERFPTRFVGSFVLPLGNIDDALRECERARSLGLRVANMPAQHRGQYLGDRRYEELWAAFEQYGITTFIHPDGVTDPWFQDYAMWNSIGQSIEEVRVMTSLIYEGVLERHPRLKIVMAHGGGYMPHYMGRLDRNAQDKPETMANISIPPSAYLRRFYYDSCVYDPRTLELLIERVGVDRVVMGGDYPVAALDPVQFLEGIGSLSPQDIAAIAGNNAVRLLGEGAPS